MGYIDKEENPRGQSPKSLSQGSPFAIRCDAGASGLFTANTKRLSAAIAQRIVRNGVEEMWEFISVLSDFKDGLLITRVWLCYPDWDEPMEIAEIQSNTQKITINLKGSQSHPA
jgi:hypothetical protein